MEDEHIAGILCQLGSRQASEAWAEFLQMYSPLILRIVRLFERDPDHVSDCFLFVCERLSQKQFRRLRRFHAKGKATFPTWLRAVVRNLCMDWHRHEFGRERVFQSVSRLGPLDQEVFSCLFLQEMSPEQTVLSLQPRFPSLTKSLVDEIEDRLRSSLSSRQLWLLEVRRPKCTQLVEFGAEGNGPPPRQIADPGRDPEALAVLNEQIGALQRGLALLSKRERLLIRLRFEHGLTLEQIARLAGLGSPQEADRKIREILEGLRRKLSS
jgi:RNA polymerase sigma factor (sigma-70 family)